MDKLQTEITVPERSAAVEKNASKAIFNLLRTCPIPEHELLGHLPLFIPRKVLSRILGLNEIYKLILGVCGDIFDFGTRWGTNMVLFANLRGIYEPFNANRRIVGFDTFEGLLKCGEKDGGGQFAKDGVLSVTSGWEITLDQLMAWHEALSPVSHIKRYEIHRGDASATLRQYLEEHQESIIALAYFDFDIYQPTKECLGLIKERLTKGSIVCFDQLNYPLYPGETIAVREVLGLRNYAIKRLRDISTSYIIIE